MRIKANLPYDIWPKVLKTSRYITNRILIKALNQKTLYKVVIGQKLILVHLYLLGCKVYVLDKTILKRHRLIKLDLRAYISYLVGYDSTNIFRIQILSFKKVIRTRDVTFDDDVFYYLSDLDVGSILREYLEDLIETLSLLEYEVKEVDKVFDYIKVEILIVLYSPQETKESLKNLTNQKASFQSPNSKATQDSTQY